MNQLLFKHQKIIAIISFLLGLFVIVAVNVIVMHRDGFFDKKPSSYDPKEEGYTVDHNQFQTDYNEFTSEDILYYEPAQAVMLDPTEKVVYLTFDDGPGPDTERLLNILDEYGIKVTFFVTNQRPDYQHLIGEAYRRGHTIALHTSSHDYAIYSSEETYLADLKEIHDICVAQTGVSPWLMRFPGGSSNKSSLSYNEGIMTRLTSQMKEYGYEYCDWNVSSGDGGGVITSNAVYNNVIEGIQRNNISVVLQHDNRSFSVDAVEDIIKWGLENGYTFLPLTQNSPLVQHKHLNN